MARAPYTPAEIEQGLTAIALHGGAGAQTQRFLKTQGLQVSSRTLQRWQTDNKQRLAEITRENLPAIEQEILAGAIETIRSIDQAEQEAVALTRQQLKDGTVRDAAGALRNLSTSKGINTDKFLALLGRPVARVQHDVQGDLRILRELGVLQSGSWDTDSTAIEAPEAE